MNYALKAVSRTSLGNRAKTVMEDGAIPAVIYGHGVEPRSVQVTATDFRKVFKAAGSSSLVDLDVDGGQAFKVVIKEVQVNPVTMIPTHIDFHQMRMDEEMTAEVPLTFTGESAAVKQSAGTLIESMDSVTVRCLPGDLPHEIIVDISVLKTFDDSISVSDLAVPKGVTIEDDGNQTVATVAAPLTEEQLKKLEEGEAHDVTAIKTEAEEKKAAEDAKAAEEAKAAESK
ncbi:MAG: 50S ribosomal protein L25 [Patescibacteria group bacterium]